MDAIDATPDAGRARDERALEEEVAAILARALPAVDLREALVVGRSRMLRVTVDHADGVDHELCAAVTDALDAGGLLDRFGIEVSSPGPEPPLRTEAHFREAVGRRVRVEVDDPAAPRGRRAHTGRLTEADGRALVIQPEDDRGARAIALGAVRRARIAEPIF